MHAGVARFHKCTAGVAAPESRDGTHPACCPSPARRALHGAWRQDRLPAIRWVTISLILGVLSACNAVTAHPDVPPPATGVAGLRASAVQPGSITPLA